MPGNPRAKFEVLADDKTAKGLRSAQKRLQAFSKRTSSILSTAFAGIGAGLLTRQIIRNTIAQEDAMTQLSAAIKSTGGVAGFTSDQLAKMAKDMQSVSRFGDEAVISMQSVLLTFTKIRGPEFERTQEAILNVATRMGTDLQAAAVQLGKALNDPVANLGELGRAGIQFSKDQKEVIKSLVETGRMAEAQGIILDELDTQFGGAARAAKDTFGGAIDSLKNAFGDLLEGSGGNLGDATQSINELADLLQDPAIVEGFGRITAAVITLTGVLAKGAAAFSEFGVEIGESLARALGAGTPIDQAAERLEFLEKQLAAVESSVVFSGTNAADRIKAEIALLEQAVQLNDELKRGRENAQDTRSTGLTRISPDRAISAVETASKTLSELIAKQEKDLQKRADSIVREFQSVEDKIAMELGEIDLVAHLLPPGIEARARDAIKEQLFDGLEEIDLSTLPTKRVTEKIENDFDGLARSIGRSMHSQLSDAFLGIETDFKGLLRRMAADFAASSILRGLSTLIPGPVGNFLKSALPGFQHGGRFTVGGSGGPDSQLVAFRATPGEPVAVGDRFVGRNNGGGSTINQNFNFPLAFPEQLEAFTRNVAGAAGRDAALQVMQANRGRI